MEKRDFEKYVNKKVYLILKSNFKYKFTLTDDCIKDNSLSFLDKFGNPVDVDFDNITFITVSTDEVQR